MTTTIVSTVSGGTGLQHDLAEGDSLFVANGAATFSDDNDVIHGAKSNAVFLAPGASVVGYAGFSSEFAIELGLSAGLVASNDLVTVSETAAISSAGSGIRFHGSGSTLVNHGLISARFSAVEDGLAFARIMNFGDIASESYGLDLKSNARVVNSGIIQSLVTGIGIDGGGNYIQNDGEILAYEGINIGAGSSQPDKTTIINNGLISTTETAVQIETLGVLEIINFGHIISDHIGIWVFNDASSPSLTVVNHGTISSSVPFGAGGAIHGSILGTNSIFNTGVIFGNVDLGNASDVFRGAKGETFGHIFAGSGDDIIRSGRADDFVNAGQGDDFVYGNAGDDTLGGGGGDDQMWGGKDDDLFFGDAGEDSIYGGTGDDEVFAGNDADLVVGNSGDDMLDGEAGADNLRGGRGDDVLIGGTAPDLLNGGKDDDTLTGGVGSKGDTFIFGRNAGNDVITDFENGRDKIDLTAFGLRTSDFASIVQPALSNAGAATSLDLDKLGGQGSVLIEGLFFSTADASDFVL